MTSPAAEIAVTLSGGAFFLCALWIAAYRPVLFLAFLFILFTFFWRTASTMYIDLAGPVLSSQTLHYIGPGLVTPLHVLAYFLTLMPFFVLLRPALIESWRSEADNAAAPQGTLTLSDATFAVSLLFLAYLFFDMMRLGQIPLFAHIERFDYTAKLAGHAHRWLIQYGNFVVFWWGVMFAAERLRNRRVGGRYLALLALLLLYMFLSGNRFSAFYSFGSFFIGPLSALVAERIDNHPATVPFAWITRGFRPRDLFAVGSTTVVLVVVVGFAIYNNLANVRGFRGPELRSEFIERTLIQPSEMGWISFERVFNFGRWQPDRVYDFLFQQPIDPGRNTTPQYLMLETIGEPRTSEHILGGFQFAGGFPEIFFELFGPIYAWPFILGASYIAAALTALMVKGVLQGRYASAFLALYVLYGFDVMYIGGMLNFVTVKTYWIKVAALAVALWVEWALARRSSSLIPWALFPVPIFLRRPVVSGAAALPPDMMDTPKRPTH
jgi:uncharacterized protein DUF6418